MDVANLLRGFKKKLKILFRKDIAYVFKQCHGVVHVGASIGQERFRYAKRGLYVLWIEPIPEVFEVLQNNIMELAKQRAVRALVSDTDGEKREFFIADNNGMSSSFLLPKKHQDAWKDIGFSRVLHLPTTRLDTIFEAGKIDRGLYDCLVLDTQGSELFVLKGAGPLLSGFRFIVAEAADFEAYEGCCTLDSVSKFLNKKGFEERLRERHPVSDEWNYFDVLFERPH